MINRIIEPLTSRCSKFRFKPLSVEVLKSRLEHIVTAENVFCNDGVVKQIISASRGDLRKAITLLQSASHLKGSEVVTGQDILEIAGVCGHEGAKPGMWSSWPQALIYVHTCFSISGCMRELLAILTYWCGASLPIVMV